MRVEICMKDPGVYDCINDAIKDKLDEEELEGDARETRKKELTEEIMGVANKFLYWGECITFYLDTEDGSFTVVERKK